MDLLAGPVTVEDVDGFLGRLAAIEGDTGATIQAFDGRYVAGRRHLEAALACADRAIANGEAIADDRGMEVLLYAAGRRQIDRALEMGITAGSTPVVVLVDGGSAAATEAVAGLAPGLAPGEPPTAGQPGRIRDYFGIGEAELAVTRRSLEALVCERVVLLAVEK